jgi:redox-sensitive bicupin YhaK (pirin superfamily)
MSPSDLGELLKPFVFLDIFEMDRPTLRAMAMPGAGMPIHPHSGIATVTLITDGWMRFDDGAGSSGRIGFGGVEWMRAGGGVWHGKEMSAGDVDRIQGFQLWLALPPDLENTEPESRYIESKDMRRAGPAYVIVGSHDGVTSPVPAPPGINYLLVALNARERWTYSPPAGHTVAWLAMAKGEVDAGEAIAAGEMVLFERSEQAITVQAAGKEDAVFVIASAVPHPYPLHMGMYSVHTSSEALMQGEQRIVELRRRLDESGDRRTAAGTVPVFR